MTKQFVERMIDALPEDWQEEVKKVFDHGATKHETVQSLITQLGHVLEHYAGPDPDPDSGCDRNAHMAARLMLALTRCVDEPFEWKPKPDTLDIVAAVKQKIAEIEAGAFRKIFRPNWRVVFGENAYQKYRIQISKSFPKTLAHAEPGETLEDIPVIVDTALPFDTVLLSHYPTGESGSFKIAGTP